MSVILTSMLQRTKFGDAGGDEALRGAATGVNEMYADTEQLACVRLMAEHSRRGRGVHKVERALYPAQIIAKWRNPCVITHCYETAPCPTLIFSKTPPHFCLYPLSAITPFTMARLWRN